MNFLNKYSIAAVAAVLLIVGGGAAAGGVAAGNGGGDDDENDVPITGEALGLATVAALEFTGEGRSPRPRSTTKTRSTRSKSPSRTAVRSMCSSTRTSS